MKLLNLTFPCSPCEHIHVNVNTEDCGLEDVSLIFYTNQTTKTHFCEELVEMNWGPSKKPKPNMRETGSTESRWGGWGVGGGC